MKTWIVSDWHCGEDRFQLMQRPGFNSAQHMVDEFVRLHNELVAPDDVVYVVGDAVNQNTPEFLPQVSRFNGIKILFRGNHERVFSDAELSEVFSEVVAEGEGRVLTLNNGLRCWITHYPTQSRPDRFNLVGHIHAAWKVQHNMLNVGVDCNHYRPHNLEEDIPFYYKAICEFYDNDVWVGNHTANYLHHGRGKKGRYLDVAGPVGG